MLDARLAGSSEIRRIQSVAAQFLHRAGIGANTATALALASGVGSGIALATQATGWGIVLLATSAALDAIDGTIARELGTPTVVGGIFDLVSDRIVETAVIIGIAWTHPELYFAALVLVASWYVNITAFLAVGAALERSGPKLIEYPPGILERSEAMIFFVALAAIESIPFMHSIGPFLCYLMTGLEIATGCQRLIFGWRTLSKAR